MSTRNLGFIILIVLTLYQQLYMNEILLKKEYLWDTSLIVRGTSMYRITYNIPFLCAEIYIARYISTKRQSYYCALLKLLKVDQMWSNICPFLHHILAKCPSWSDVYRNNLFDWFEHLCCRYEISVCITNFESSRDTSLVINKRNIHISPRDDVHWV